MDWAGKQHPLETLVEWCAPALFAGAVGWSTNLSGLAPTASIATTGVAFAVAIMAMRLAESGSHASFSAFEPASLEAGGAHLEELLLDNPLEADEVQSGELLLDDPLIDIAEDARVVRLFAAQEPTPGELAARIEGFLGDGFRSAMRRSDAAPAQPAIPDAGAALQAALANVRASLKTA